MPNTAETAFVADHLATDDFVGSPDPLAAGLTLANRISAERNDALREVASLRAVNADRLAALKIVAAECDPLTVPAGVKPMRATMIRAANAANAAIAKAEGR